MLVIKCVESSFESISTDKWWDVIVVVIPISCMALAAKLFHAFGSRPDHQVAEVERVLMACMHQNELDALVAARDGNGFSVLTHACLKGCEDGVLKCLAVAGAKLTAVEPNGLRVLHNMVQHQRPGPIKALLELGCDWRAGERSCGDTALWHAIKRPHSSSSSYNELRLRCVQALVEHCPQGKEAALLYRRPTGSNSSTSSSLSTSGGECALHVVCSTSDDDAVCLALLVNLTTVRSLEGPKTVDLDVVDGRGHTPLWVAASKGHVDCCTLLLNLGAQVDRAGQEGSTPLRVAARNGGVGENPKSSLAKVVALLLAHGASAFKASLSETETVAATQGAFVAATPVQMASLKGRSTVKAVGGLAADGSGPMNAQHPTNGRTALHEACVQGKAEAARLLVAEGADINLRDKAGFTALELSVYFEEDLDDDDDDDDDHDDDEGGGSEDGGGGGEGTGRRRRRKDSRHNKSNTSKSNPLLVGGRKVGGRGEVESCSRAQRRKAQKRMERFQGRERCQCFLIGQGGCDLGTQAQAERLAWRAAFSGSESVIRALGKHPTGHLILCAKPDRPTPQEAEEAALGMSASEEGPVPQAPGAGPRFHGCPALWIATVKGNLGCVKALLEGGADPNAPYVLTGPRGRYQSGTWLSGMVPLQGKKNNLTMRPRGGGIGGGKRLVHLGQAGEVGSLLRGTELLVRGPQRVRPSYVPPPDGTAPLHQAALHGHLEILSLLLRWKRGGNASQALGAAAAFAKSGGGSGGSGLGAAAGAAEKMVRASVVVKGVDLNKRVVLDPQPKKHRSSSGGGSVGGGGRPSTGSSSSSRGSGEGDDRKHGGSGGSGGGGGGEWEGCTALHLACSFGQVQVCEMLLSETNSNSKAVQVDALDDLGRTPLLCLCEANANALAAGSSGVLAGGSGSSSSSSSRSGSGSRRGRNHTANSAALPSSSPPPPSLSSPSLSSTFEAISALLLAHGACAERKDWMGRTVVQLAAAKDRKLVTEQQHQRQHRQRQSVRNGACSSPGQQRRSPSQQQQRQEQKQLQQSSGGHKPLTAAAVPPIPLYSAEDLQVGPPAPPPRARLDFKQYQTWVHSQRSGSGSCGGGSGRSSSRIEGRASEDGEKDDDDNHNDDEGIVGYFSTGNVRRSDTSRSKSSQKDAPKKKASSARWT